MWYIIKILTINSRIDVINVYLLNTGILQEKVGNNKL